MAFTVRRNVKELMHLFNNFFHNKILITCNIKHKFHDDSYILGRIIHDLSILNRIDVRMTKIIPADKYYSYSST